MLTVKQLETLKVGVSLTRSQVSGLWNGGDVRSR